jgi:hypothetical protein
MKTIQIEVQLSDWANYVAQDEDDAWWEFEEKPFLGEMESVWWNEDGRKQHIAYGPPNENWRDSLRKV